jgi:type II secretory pathway component PulF
MFILSQLLYPALLLHLASGLLPLPQVLARGWSPWWLAAGPAALWLAAAAVAAALFAARASGLGARLAFLPGARLLTESWVGANACTVLRAALLAGIRVREALELAADASGNRLVKARLRAAGRELEEGRIGSIAAALAVARLDPVTVQVVAGAEVGGKTDEALERAAVVNREALRLRSEWTARMLTGGIYLLSLLLAAATVLSLFQSLYVDQIKQVAAEIP